MKYATRLNSFLLSGKTVIEAIDEIGHIDGITHVDFNYPEHFADSSIDDIIKALNRNNLKANAISPRYRKDFISGSFSNILDGIADNAIKLTLDAIDVCKKINGNQIIIWLASDGFDYNFQMDYINAWNKIVYCIRKICDFSDIQISIEYKPYEERSYSVIDSFGITMMMLQNVGKENLGITLDFCHMLMKKENPAFAAAVLLEQGKLFNVHMNDGDGLTDSGLMVGMVNLWKTLEFAYYLKKYNYDGIIYFDTFPKREDPIRECISNVLMFNKVLDIIDKTGIDNIYSVIKSNDAIQIQKMYRSLLI